MTVDAEVVLIAEDDADHLLILRRAFKQAGLINPVQIVRDGDEAVAYLDGVGKFANRDEYPLPALLLLDLKLPKRDGFSVLEWIRRHPTLNRLRVVVLTSSADIKDVNRAYTAGANSFLTKPLDFRDFVDMSRAIKGHWLWMSRAPDVLRSEHEQKPGES